MPSKPTKRQHKVLITITSPKPCREKDAVNAVDFAILEATGRPECEVIENYKVQSFNAVMRGMKSQSNEAKLQKALEIAVNALIEIKADLEANLKNGS